MSKAIPDINIKTAISFYYLKNELSNDDIKELFNNKIGGTVLKRLKRMAQDLMIEKNTVRWDAAKVNTRVALEAWGHEISDLETRFNKLKRLGLLEDASVWERGGEKS